MHTYVNMFILILIYTDQSFIITLEWIWNHRMRIMVAILDISPQNYMRFDTFLSVTSISSLVIFDMPKFERIYVAKISICTYFATLVIISASDFSNYVHMYTVRNSVLK